MGTPQIKLLKAPSQSFVLQSAHFQQTSFPPLADTEEQAQQLFSRLVKQYAEKEGVEQLKATDQMKWVQRMDSILEITNETIIRNIIYS